MLYTLHRVRIVNPTAKLGEDAAVNYLQKKRYKILVRNFHIRGGEIDIVAQKNNTLVFVEVKTRSSSYFGTPFEAITYFKMQSLLKTIAVFTSQYPHLPQSTRLDAIAVFITKNNEVYDILHEENISGF